MKYKHYNKQLSVFKPVLYNIHHLSTFAGHQSIVQYQALIGRCKPHSACSQVQVQVWPVAWCPRISWVGIDN